MCRADIYKLEPLPLLKLFCHHLIFISDCSILLCNFAIELQKFLSYTVNQVIVNNSE